MDHNPFSRFGVRALTLIALGATALAATQSSGPRSVIAKNLPKWLSSKPNVVFAGQCLYQNGSSANNVGKARNTNDGNCANTCATTMVISPLSANAQRNTPMQLNFRVRTVLGGPNQVCTSHGTVDWGDGTKTELPSDPWKNCDGGASEIIHDTVGKPVNINLSHSFPTAGEYCVSASVWGNHKYDGDGSCSYDCTVSAAEYVQITP